jgi:quinol-cytochrome oxidoreductase complex cytochrome b subunit
VLNWNNAIRQIHRWLSIAFTAAVVVNIVAMTQQQQPGLWIGLLALFPLILLLATGLYMFVLPYAVKWRNG